MSVVNSEEEIGENLPNPIQFNPNGMFLSLHDDKTIEFLAKNTNFDEPLYNVVTSNTFERYSRIAIRPDFVKLSRKALRRKIVDVYRNSKKDLVELFSKNGYRERVGISCDLWSSFGFEDRYLCVTCHWIDNTWNLEKRVIGFEILYPFDYVDIASKIVQVLDEFGLKDRVGSISFGDRISKEKCMEHLVKEFKPVVPVELDLFAHDRTYATVVDLCAQHAVDELAEFIDPIREVGRWLRFSPDKRLEFKALCKEKGLKPRRFYLDCSKDWKSTFDNLKVAYDYKEVLTKLYNGCANHSPLVDSQWDGIKEIISLVSKFVEVSRRFSKVYDVGCHLVLKDCITIAHTLKKFESDPRFCSVVKTVRSKWLELFREIPNIYCAATILDPRVKVEGLRHLLAYYYETLGLKYDVDEKVANCKKALHQLYTHYALPWKGKSFLASDSEENYIKVSSSLELNMKRNKLKRKRVDDQEESGQLGEYLFFQFQIPDDDDDEKPSIQEWWFKRQHNMHILSKLAMAVLSTPISTHIPKPKLCPGKRVLDEKRSMLPPSLIKVCICKKDWDLAAEYLQDEEDVSTDYSWDSSSEED